MLKPVESERILAAVADEMDVEMSVFTVGVDDCILSRNPDRTGAI